MPGSRPASRQRQQSSLSRPAATGPAIASRQRSAGANRSAAVATAPEGRAQKQLPQGEQQERAASGASSAKAAGRGKGPGKLAALGKRKVAAAQTIASVDEEWEHTGAAAMVTGRAPARHVTWDKSPLA